MRRRQVHLDFHTSEKIPGIGSKFSKENFQSMLKLGHVDSITVFSKCHHGWSYHPTKVNKMHPELSFDLLKAQIEAAHEIDVKTPVYISAGYDEKTAVEHPEWLLCKELGAEPDFSVPHYHKFCFNNPYLDKLLGEIREVCENYDADGIFLDIVSVKPCYCSNCLRLMKEQGLDPENKADVLTLAEQTYAMYTRRVRETIDSVKPGLPVFHNGGHIRHGRRDLAHMDTHLELESLPTGGWGYDHFPMSAAYVRTIGMEYLGMTGKFHKTWGEFGGFKHPNALKYEVALSAANGAKCSIGDQLAPNGMMDEATYALIGEAYETLEKAEPWLEGAKNVADVAVLSNEAVLNYYGELNFDEKKMKDSNAGCTRILLESHILFDLVDTEADLSAYKLLILPDFVVLDEALAAKVQAFIAEGGKVLASYQSGLNPECSDFALDFGCKFEGMSEYNPTYIRPCFELPSLRNSAYIIYRESTKVSASDGQSSAIVEVPYFNRTVEHFCSHRHAPASGEKYGDAVVLGENTAYLSQALFYEYFESGNIYTKEIVRHVIEMLLGEARSVTASLPAQGILTMMEGKDRLLVHTLYASPVRRGLNIEIIEDIIPLYNIKVSVHADRAPKAVTLVPQKESLPFTYENGSVSFTIPELNCWQMTEIQF